MAISIEVWGDFACFTPPYAKVERLTYPFPTPSACRGILSAIYSKPAEFYWQIDRIEILNPIQYISFKRNEVKTRVTAPGRRIPFRRIKLRLSTTEPMQVPRRLWYFRQSAIWRRTQKM